MILAFDLKDLPGEAITVLALLIFSFLGWLKDRVIAKKVEPEPIEDEEMREVIWRRQMGETGEDTRMPWESPEPTIQFDPPPVPMSQPAPPPLPAPAVKVSARQEALANAFERSTRRQGGRRTSHRKQIDRLLKSPSSAKDAILLMEILGPPVGLKEEQQANV